MTKPAKPPKSPKLGRRRWKRLSWLERADIMVLRGLEPALRSRAGKLVGKLGNLADEPILLGLASSLVAGGLIRSDSRLRRTGLAMLLAQGAAIGVKTLGKNTIDRSRPNALLDHNRYVMRWGDSRAAALRAFPSGHTAGAVAAARTLARHYPRMAAPAYALATALGVLQIFRRAHFPGDVAAGALIGLTAESVTHRGMVSAAR